jgi:hypothetical protein
MNAEACRKRPTSWQSIPRAEPSSLNVGDQRARDLKKRRVVLVAADVDNELPRSSHGDERVPFYRRPT